MVEGSAGSLGETSSYNLCRRAGYNREPTQSGRDGAIAKLDQTTQLTNR